MFCSPMINPQSFSELMPLDSELSKCFSECCFFFFGGTGWLE